MGEIIVLISVVIHLIFFYWLVRQFFDFGNKKFTNPSPGAKVLMFFYFMLMSVGGVKEGDELIPTIAASVLILGIITQLVFGITIAVRKIRTSKK